APLPSATEQSVEQLSRRLRQTLACLLDGDSEKQVAGRLGLSQATVHQYVTTLYRHFGVHSRAELLVYVLRRMPQSEDPRRDLAASDSERLPQSGADRERFAAR